MIDQNVYNDTIFALSSGRLPSGVAVVRLSGPQVRFAIETIASTIPEPRMAAYRALHSAQGELLDHGLALFFPGPASFTGEDCAEFHLHGGIAVVERFLQELSTFPHHRIAEAGEFTRRAFANGKMDLTVAEGLADLISAETEGQRRLALQVASGKQRDLYRGWRTQLIQARAFIEAELDFADETDVPGSVSDRVWNDMEILRQEILYHLASSKRANLLRDGFHIVIAGAPNAGKSSLLNLLAGRDVAIISEEPGTTRDLLEVKLDLGGIPVYLTDTAGLRDTESKVEKIGIERARERAAEADLILLLQDISQTDDDGVALDSGDAEVWKIGNKADLGQAKHTNTYNLQISVRDQLNIDELVDRLTRLAIEKAGMTGDVVPTRLRHVNLLNETARELQTAIERSDYPLELRAENLRLASQSLGRITGEVDVEDILDVIFSEFCIGK